MQLLSRDERGFTMVTVISALLVVTLLSVAALSYAQTDLPAGAKDRDRKMAYAAAEAGVQNYAFYLAQDPAYWTKCTSNTPPQINQRWNGIGPEVRRFVPVPDSTTSEYAIELLPANGESICDVSRPESTMLDTPTRTFRIRVTGRVGGLNGVKRSIVVNFKRKSLLDYVYFTDKETLSPILAPVQVGSRPTRRPSSCVGTACRDLKTWAVAECDRYYGNDADGLRQSQKFDGQYKTTNTTSTWSTLDVPCFPIVFIGADVIAGPFHTNDEFDCNGSPTFGLNAQDPIETSSKGQTADPAAGYRSCTPHFVGTHDQNAAPIDIPPTNEALYRDTAASYRFVGHTQITLTGTTMTVTGTRENGTSVSGVSMPIPPNGVVYVSNRTAGKPPGSPGYPCPGYNVLNPYELVANDACGNLEVKGNYDVNVTLTAENDIIVMDNITRPVGSPTPDPDVLLGLISNNFIRVYHPVTGCEKDSDENYGCNWIDGCANASGQINSTTIDAAILSLNHSFILDNFHCGTNLGTLTVRGAIVQKFRGAVGRGSSGYTKAYSYDTRLRFRAPPKFLDPVQAGWRVQTYNEQVPAR